MAAPTNTSAGTAVVIASLPYSITQTVDDAGTTYPVYYQYTAVTGDNVIGVWGLGSADLTTYIPTTAVFSPNGSTAYMGGTGGVNVPFQIPVTAGQTYWFKFTPNGGNPSPAVLTLNVQRHQDQNVPTGSIAINDDTYGFPLALLDAANDNTVLSFVQNIAAGEGGDILPNGLLLLEDISTSNQLTLYDASYNLVATISAIQCNVVSTNKVDTFYIGDTTSGVTDATVTTVDSSGVLGPTTWTLTGTISLAGLAPSPDETILYYFRGGGSNLPIKAWDLVNDVALPDLVSGVGAGYALQKDLLCLGDGSIIVMVRNTGTTTQECRRYDSSGVLQNTYTLTYGLSSTGGDRMAYGLDDTSFWVQQKGNPEQIGTISEIRVSDGTVLTTRTYRYFETGTYQGSATLTPDARFGPSFSCPFWITRSASSAPPGLSGPAGLAALRASGALQTYPIRRVRIAPTTFDKDQRIFHRSFELFTENGNGVVTGQGDDPTIELHISNDGGYTYPIQRTLTTGRLGDYSHRVYATQLGQSRRRVYKVIQTDPVNSVWIGADIEVEEGLN